MERDGTEPQPALALERDAAQEIHESFQAILDALDAARAALHVEDGSRRRASPPRSFDHHNEAATNGSRADPAKAPSSPQAPPPPAGYPRTQRMGPGPAGLVSAPPQGVPPSVVDPPRTSHVRQAPQDPMVQPLWSQGARQEAGKQPTASDAGPTRSEPSATRPVLGPVRASVGRGAGSPPDASWTADPGRSAPHTAPLGAPPHQAPPRPDTVRPTVLKGSPGHRRFTNRRHARAAGFFGLGAVSGLILASSLLTNEHSEPAAPPASLEQPEQPLPGGTSLPEIPGTGVLREGDSGHGVYELQVRLLQIPQLYDGGAIDGRFDTEVRQAVARFQKRFGIRGDETGVYGDNTRYALMLRTK